MPNPELCRDIVRQLWPYLDGALPDEWQERVAAHLEECVNCRSHYDYERAFLDAVRESSALTQEFEPLRARVVAALQAQGMTVEG
ncbi:MAG: zf-HC2 domain-containing protein [Gemmatimonadaceae bacterium]